MKKKLLFLQTLLITFAYRCNSWSHNQPLTPSFLYRTNYKRSLHYKY